MRTQLVDGLFADLLQVVSFLRVYNAVRNYLEQNCWTVFTAWISGVANSIIVRANIHFHRPIFVFTEHQKNRFQNKWIMHTHIWICTHHNFRVRYALGSNYNWLRWDWQHYSIIPASTSGVPVLVVSLLVGVNDREDFITERACWCRGDGVVFWTFVGTIGLTLLVKLISRYRQGELQTT